MLRLKFFPTKEVVSFMTVRNAVFFLILLSVFILSGCGGTYAVFGDTDVFFDVVIDSKNNLYWAPIGHEQTGENYNPTTDALVCQLDFDREHDNMINGYRHFCSPTTNQHMRENHRIICTNYTSMACDPETQRVVSNPTQVYRDIPQTEFNYIRGFTGEAGVYGGRGLELNYEALMADFDPDTHRDICEGTNCITDWLDASGSETGQVSIEFDPDEGLPLYHDITWRNETGISSFDLEIYEPGEETQVSVGGAALIVEGVDSPRITAYDPDGSVFRQSSSRQEIIPGSKYAYYFESPGSDFPDDMYIMIDNRPCTISNPGSDAIYCNFPQPTGTRTLVENNLCCGDDPDDVGYFAALGDSYYACIQNADRNYEWIPSNAGPENDVYGNIYSIFDESFYEIETVRVNDSWVVQEKQIYPIKYDLLVADGKFYACNVHDTSVFRGSNIDGSSNTLIDISKNKAVRVSSTPVREYLCYEETINIDGVDITAGRFAECYGQASINRNALEYYEGGIPLWVSFSMHYREPVRRLATFDRMPLQVEEWDTVETNSFFGGTDVLPGRPQARGLKLEYVKQDTVSRVFSISAKQFPIKNWHDYKYLEGEVRGTQNYALDIVINGNVIPIDSYITTPVTSRNVYKYFKIDLDTALPGILRNNITNISFQLDGSQASFKSQETYTYHVTNLNLVKDQGAKYCGLKNGEYLWLETRDESPESCFAAGGVHTGNYCCGSKAGQFFADGNSSCWNSNYVPFGIRFQHIDLSINGYDFEFFCSNEGGRRTCEFPMPRIPDLDLNDGFSIDNPNPEFYSATFVNSGNTSTNQSTDTIRVSIHRYEYMGMEDEMLFCGPGDPRVPTLRQGEGWISSAPYVSNPIHGDVCSVTDNFYCSASGGWINNMDNIQRRRDSDMPFLDNNPVMPSISERDVVKGVPLDQSLPVNGTRFECCPSDYCWNGNICVENEKNDPARVPSFMINDFGDGLRCIDGEWEVSFRKHHPTLRQTGYCPSNDQCFISARGNASHNDLSGNMPQCIGDGMFVADHYCDAGDWTSRTKFLASAMMDSFNVPQKISVYCDSYTHVLNYLGGFDGKDVSNFVRGGSLCAPDVLGISSSACMNNFCVLANHDQSRVMFGTSINQAINATNNSVSELFDISCEAPVSGGGLQDCGDGVWYYDPDMGLVIFSEDFSKDRNAFVDWVVSTFTRLRNWLMGSGDPSLSFQFGESPRDISFIRNDHKYDTIYYFHGGSQEVTAVRGRQYGSNETSGLVTYIGVRYDQFRFSGERDICDYISRYNERYGENVICDFVEGTDTYYLFSTNPAQSHWQALTASLRLSE